MDLANVRAPAGLAPRVPVNDPALLADRLDGTTGACDVPVILPTTPDASKLVRPTGAPRPQCYGASYGYGMTKPWPGLTGEHGVIPDYLPPPGMSGGQEPWRAWNPRTLRHEPTTPWDDGITQGNAR
jgi:hypothetical protein